MEQIKTLAQAIVHFADPENCRKFMVFVRWPDGTPRCPYCGATKLTWLAKASVYRCYGDHKKQKFSLKVGTVFEDSAIGLDKWLPAVWLLSNCKNGISSYELSRAIGVTQKTAWFMLHRIRLAMQSGSFDKMGGPEGGPVEVDEAYIGGEPKNRHQSKRVELVRTPKYVKNKYGFTVKNPEYKAETGKGTLKTPVFGMLDRDMKQVRAHAIPAPDRQILLDAILANIEKGGKIYSDSLPAYKSLPSLDFIHEAVNHMTEYVRGEVHTQGIENFWSLLKRGLKGTYVAVEPFHLDAYITEQVFRYNNRATKDNPLTDADRFVLAVSQVAGKRLTYAELTGKVGETTV
jgi:ISXO2-like transposase domain/Transposase zinc-ribbon domain